MKFALEPETRQFAESVDAMLARKDVPAAIRAWNSGDTAPGLALWSALAEQGVWALGVPEEHDGMGATPVEAVAIAEVLGARGLPGPAVETLFVVPRIAAATGSSELYSAVVKGSPVTAAASGVSPLAPGVDVAVSRLLITSDGGVLSCPEAASQASVDRARRVAALDSEGAEKLGEADFADVVDHGALGTAAVQLGLAGAMLRMAVDYAKQRSQFGRPIGEQQAIKHEAADVAIAVEMARPLLWAGALALTESPGSEQSHRDVSAAALACGRAADLAARNALQIHGAIGYTMEHDLGLYLTKSRALQSSWGTPAFHRARVLAAIEGAGASR
ncbi:acyl-CoA dehydrogenase family protein [Dietzia sp.]|uniref:acyl-CoA dehydrogenase family protein n=1 Tax=Dietzia sp. TaxID=1871616 RepID=UPI002FD8C7DF